MNAGERERGKAEVGGEAVDVEGIKSAPESPIKSI